MSERERLLYQLDKAGSENMTAYTRRPPKHTHVWLPNAEDVVRCVFCGMIAADYEASQKRGKTSGRSGKDGERLVVAEAGPDWKRVGQYGTPVDVEAPWAVGQVKTGGHFSNSDQIQLDRMMPYANGRLRLLFKVNRPGTGKRKMIQVVTRLSELLAAFGDVQVAMDMEDWPQWLGRREP